jgi:hypothetical protein
MSIKNCGPMICTINDQQFTYVEIGELIPQLTLFFYDEFNRAGINNLNNIYEFYKIVIDDADKLAIDTAVYHVIRYVSK